MKIWAPPSSHIIAPPPPTGNPYANFIYGLNADWIYTADTGMSSATQATTVGNMFADGFRLLRHTFNWKALEPNAPTGGASNPGAQGTHTWHTAGSHETNFDFLVLNAARAGLEVLAMFFDVPAWITKYPLNNAGANNGINVSHATAITTANIPYQDSVIKFLVGRYGPGGTLWAENPDVSPIPIRRWALSNEMNASNGTFWWGTNLAPAVWKTSTVMFVEYANQYRAFRAAIKSIDPLAKTHMGGLTEGPSSLANPGGNELFVQGVYNVDPTLVFDCIEVHPYSSFTTNAVAATFGKGASTSYVYPIIKRLRNKINSTYGPSVPIMVTEQNWNTYRGTATIGASYDLSLTPPGATLAIKETNHGSFLSDTAFGGPHSDCNMIGWVWFTGVSPETGDADNTTNRDRWWGLYDRSGNPYAWTNTLTAEMAAVKVPTGWSTAVVTF